MYHSYRHTVRCCHHIDLSIYLRQRFFQDDHGKYRSTCGYVTGAYGYAVSRCHTGSCVTFRRAHQTARLQVTAYIQKFCTFFGQRTCVFSCRQNLWQDLSQFPWISFFFFQFIELFYHLLVIIYGFRIDREHTGSVADTQNFLPGQFPVDITGQCSEKCDIFYMFFTV